MWTDNMCSFMSMCLDVQCERESYKGGEAMKFILLHKIISIVFVLHACYIIIRILQTHTYYKCKHTFDIKSFGVFPSAEMIKGCKKHGKIIVISVIFIIIQGRWILALVYMYM